MPDNIVSAAELMRRRFDPETIRHLQARERNFRRGYHQAYEVAIAHVRAGHSLEEMCRQGDRIQRWRERGPNAYPGAPPTLGQVDERDPDDAIDVSEGS